MSNKNSSEAQDTLKLSVPKPSRPAAEETRVYSIPKQRTRANSSNRPNAKPLRPASAGEEHTVNMPARHTLKTDRSISENSNIKENTSKGKSISADSDSSIRKDTKKIPVKASSKSAKTVSNEDSYREPEFLTGREKRKHKKKKNPFSVFIKSIVAVLLAIFVIYSAIMLSIIRKVSPIEKTGQYQNDMSTLLYSSDVKNILVIGTDTRDMNDRGLSDSMILVSLNGKNHKIQMTSFMRDMYTEIDGYDFEKLNAAYSYGGAELLVDTIEDNFKIRIDSCVTVNFISVAYMIDSIGGIEIEMSSDEADEINTIMYSEVNEIMGDERDSDFLPVEPGKYKLNGKQALSYSRIRHVGNADFERTQRQRTVVTEVLHKFKKANPLSFISNMKKAAVYVASDMDTLEMYSLSLKLPYYLIAYDIEQMRIPIDGSWDYDVTWDDQSILSVDFAQNTEYLKNQIYLQGRDSKKNKTDDPPVQPQDNNQDQNGAAGNNEPDNQYYDDGNDEADDAYNDVADVNNDVQNYEDPVPQDNDPEINNNNEEPQDNDSDDQYDDDTDDNNNAGNENDYENEGDEPSEE